MIFILYLYLCFMNEKQKVLYSRAKNGTRVVCEQIILSIVFLLKKFLINPPRAQNTTHGATDGKHERIPANGGKIAYHLFVSPNRYAQKK